MTWLLVVVFVQALVPGEVEIHAEHEHADDIASHSSPCPDETPDGEPCGDACECLCCPGHARVLPPIIRSRLGAALHSEQELYSPAAAPSTFELLRRIFRPPRAA